MTKRALLLGLLLGLAIAGSQYFNDSVIRQASLVGNLFPTAVIGALCVLLLAVNPLLRAIGAQWPLRRGELLVIMAMGLASCYWPGSVFNSFVQKLATPAHWQLLNPSWQSAEVMSYVPSGSPRFGHGHVQQPRALAEALVAAAERGDSEVASVWAALPPHAQAAVREAARTPPTQAIERDGIVAAMNLLVEGPVLDVAVPAERDVPDDVRALLDRHHQHRPLTRYESMLLNRWLLVSAFPHALLPPPQGGALLPAGAQADPQVVGQVMAGSDQPVSLMDLPWAQWWPTLRLWCGLGLLLAGMVICLALVVHPQWSQRELLSYPVAKVIEEATAPGPGRWLPAVASSRLFWIGFATIASIRLINGLHDWFPDIVFIEIPLQVNFTPLRTLFPSTMNIPGSYPIFAPTMFPVVFAFAFFLTREVSLSLGLAGIVWMIFGSVLINRGVDIDLRFYGDGDLNMMLFGAYLGGMLMVLYVGRRYYLLVARHVLLPARGDQVPTYVVWAGRALLVFAVALVVMLTRAVGLDWPLSVLFVLLTAMFFVMVSRIHVETGALTIQPYWFPLSVLTALLGVEAIGPTAYIAMALVTTVLIEGTHAALMPSIANALRLGSRASDEPAGSPSRVVPLLALMVVLSLVVALGASFYFQYNRGLFSLPQWGTQVQPSIPFDDLTLHLNDLMAHQRLEEATRVSGLARFNLIEPRPVALGWMALGFVLVMACTIARLRLPWWPIHPVLFLVLGTYAGSMFAGSFLLGWIVKSVTLNVGGTKAHDAVKPMMLGIILGEVSMGLIWIIAGTAYFALAGVAP